MADCNNTEVFLKEWRRMCDSLQRTCQQCYLYEIVDTGSCHTAMRTMPNQVIEIVQKWSNEHPKKTRQSEFLKMFPNARLDFDSVLVIEPCAVDKNFASTYCISDHCYICRAEYWLAEVE